MIYKIPLVKPYLGKNASRYVNDCLDSGWISSQGKYVRMFEERFAGYIGTKYALAVSNGTSALHLALLGLGIKKGDKVSVPNLTFAATINTILYTGATPEIIGTDVNTLCLDWRYVKSKIVIPVHLYGYPTPIPKSNKIIIEDCAEALGAEIDGKKVGSIGMVGCFSFFANKILTTGEGGMVTTNDSELYLRMKKFRDHGKDEGYHHSLVGYNYRMTALQAAVGLAQLEEIDWILERRREIYDWYSRLIPDTRPNISGRVNWLYTTLIDNRDKVIESLYDNGIESRPIFEPLNTMDIYKKYVKIEYKNSVSLSKRGISLPTYIGLTENDVELISGIVNANSHI